MLKQDIVPYEEKIMKKYSMSVKNIENIPVVPYVQDDVVEKTTKQNCKVCQLTSRDEVEKIFESTNNCMAAHRWLKEQGEDISYPAVRNHMIWHFKEVKRRQGLLEYAEDIKRWASIRGDNLTNSLRIRIAILERNMISIDEAGEDLSLSEKRKNAETVKKLADTILSYENKLEEHIKEMEPVSMIFNSLKIIITDEMKQHGTKEIKKVLTNVLDRLQEQVNAMEIIVE